MWRERRLLALCVILLASLGTSATLAEKALVAARSHQRTAQRTLRNYAAFGAWIFATIARERLSVTMRAAFAPLDAVRLGSPGAPLPDPTVVLASAQRADPCDGAAAARRFAFRYEPGDGSLATAGAAPPRPSRLWLDALTAVRRSAESRLAPFGFLYGASGSAAEPLAYALVRDRGGRVRAVYGFPTCALTGPHSVFARLTAERPLLPTALTGVLTNDSLFAVRVTDPRGRVLYRGAAAYTGPYVGEAHVPEGAHGLRATLTLRPDLAGSLLLGGVPRSQLAMLGGLLALSATLIALVFVMVRREERFARARSRFLADVSHELRTPLAQIRVFAELLRLGRLRSEADRERALAVVDKEARRLGHLVDNVLRFSRAERAGGAPPLALAEADLAPQVQDAVETYAPLAASHGVRIDSSGVGAGARVMLDAQAFRQVLLNLLDNAVKYGPRGQVVRVGLEVAGPAARLTVDDEGPGVAPAERERVWLPFYRSDGDATAATGGSGLGLAVVRDLVRRHGGRTWIERAPTGGARAVVELPLATPIVAPARAAGAASRAGGAILGAGS